MSGLFTLLSTTQLQECRYTVEEKKAMKNYNKLHRCSNHIQKQFKKEKLVSNSMDDFKNAVHGK